MSNWIRVSGYYAVVISYQLTGYPCFLWNRDGYGGIFSMVHHTTIVVCLLWWIVFNPIRFWSLLFVSNVKWNNSVWWEMAKFLDEIGPIHHISSLIDPNKIIRPRLKWILIYTCDWSQNVSNRNHSQRRSMVHYQKEWSNGEIQFPSFCARSLLRCVVFWFGTVQLYPYPTRLHAWHMVTRLFHRHLRKTRWHVLIHCANFHPPPSKKKQKKHHKQKQNTITQPQWSTSQ